MKTNKLLALYVTYERTGDGQMLPSLIEQAQWYTNGQVIHALGDGAYDSKATFNYLDGQDIRPVIKTWKDASTRARGSLARAVAAESDGSLVTTAGEINTVTVNGGWRKPIFWSETHVRRDSESSFPRSNVPRSHEEIQPV
ncbi:MAG: hypothetical protein ACP5FL_07750 [Thermoplasmatota archaeon]